MPTPPSVQDTFYMEESPLTLQKHFFVFQDFEAVAEGNPTLLQPAHTWEKEKKSKI